MNLNLAYLNPGLIREFIKNALAEDLGPGDHSTLAAIDAGAEGCARLIIKEKGILAGQEVAGEVFALVDKALVVELRKQDGEWVNPGETALTVTGSARSILSAERLVLNFMQRMSGIATKTRYLTDMLAGTGAALLDTRKTTPNFRMFEKWAVKIGGGHNHRFALYDMMLLKDNHIDFAGGIAPAVARAREYLAVHKLKLKIEVETRNLEEVKQALAAKADIIMLDNMPVATLARAVQLVGKQCPTEASGGIDERNIRAIAGTGVDFISVGALTHSYKSLDMSLKADIGPAG